MTTNPFGLPFPTRTTDTSYADEMNRIIARAAARDADQAATTTAGLTAASLATTCMAVLTTGRPAMFGTLELDAADPHGEATARALLAIAAPHTGRHSGETPR